MGRKENRLVEYLSLVKPEAVPVDKAIAYLNNETLSVKVLVKEAIWNRVSPQLFSNIRYLMKEVNVNSQVIYAIEEEILRTSPLCINKVKHTSLLQKIIRGILEVEENVIFVKGTIMQNLYLAYTSTCRMMRDIDVLFPDVSSFHRFLTSIRDLGYYIGDKNIKMYSDPVIFSPYKKIEIPYSSLKLLHIHLYPTLKDNKINIDVKVADRFFLPMDDLSKRKIKFSLGETEFWGTCWTDVVYILLTHALEHTYIKWCWMNDLHLLCTKTSLDWEYLLNRFLREGRLPLFYKILKHLSRKYKDGKYNTIIGTIKDHSKFLIHHRTSWVYKRLLKVNAKDKSTTKFLLYTENLLNRKRHWITTWIMLVFFLFKMFRASAPQWSSSLLRKINSCVIPLKIKFGCHIKLPTDYKICSTHLSKEDNLVVAKWSKKTGFQIECPYLTMSQY